MIVIVFSIPSWVCSLPRVDMKQAIP